MATQETPLEQKAVPRSPCCRSGGSSREQENRTPCRAPSQSPCRIGISVMRPIEPSVLWPSNFEFVTDQHL
jgi:hypothetical protein